MRNAVRYVCTPVGSVIYRYTVSADNVIYVKNTCAAYCMRQLPLKNVPGGKLSAECTERYGRLSYD